MHAVHDTSKLSGTHVYHLSLSLSFVSHALPLAASTAGIPVVARANVSLPGYRQHLGQAMLGAYDLTSELCPDSLRPDHCRLVGTLEVSGGRGQGAAGEGGDGAGNWCVILGASTIWVDTWI